MNTVKEVIDDIRAGKMVIITDDESRENEGDLVFAAQHVTPEMINFMTKFGRGLICVPLPAERIRELGLRDMVDKNDDAHGTAFTVSVDAKQGTTTGISAGDRARTVEVLANPEYGFKDLSMPGHMFPLRAKKGGVLARAGHTEAGVDLARLAGCYPAAVICEIMNDDGSMARMPELKKFAKKHGLKMCTIEKLIAYCHRYDKLVERVAQAKLPTMHGQWRIVGFRSLIDDKEHIALIMGDVSKKPALVRVHSECFTGDVLGSLRCDCQSQLHAAMNMIEKEGAGVILYLRQEGRGIGLCNKIKAYELQDNGLDTVEANEQLGFKDDQRCYGVGAQILSDLGLKELRLITNNPRKLIGLEGFGLAIVERVEMPVTLTQFNQTYLQTKKDKLGHLLDM